MHSEQIGFTQRMPLFFETLLMNMLFQWWRENHEETVLIVPPWGAFVNKNGLAKANKHKFYGSPRGEVRASFLTEYT